MDANSIYSGNSLKAADLQGHEIPVMISKVALGEFKERDGSTKKKIVLHFEGKTKTLVVNKVNKNRIVAMYGANTDLWIGNEITLYEDQVEFGTDLVPAIRVKVIKKAAPATNGSFAGGQNIESGPQPTKVPAPPKFYNDSDMPSDEIPF